MELRFHLSGTTVFSTEAVLAPGVGSVFIIKTESYKKGLRPGSVVRVEITDDDPPVWDFTEPGGPVVLLSINGYEMLKEGPLLDSE
ncbi:hypothetical protein [Asticcacaulis sp.]|uniref:hypothetical protein n=1 Tax=Asticcacaulis sp. TaxID=1872648 RepID=UPI002626E718|nr:hypothetical protein [Asticcacaulis sp.]